MNDAPRATIEKLYANGNGLRVEFYWRGDRFGHTISAVKDGVALVEWRSVDDDPLGPVYQELHEQETAEGGKIVFLSGAGNGAHWSASVEFEKVKCFLVFDVATRITSEPLLRPITYRGEFLKKPHVMCGGDLVQAEEDPPLVRFRTFSLEEALPVTQRCKYTFFA